MTPTLYDRLSVSRDAPAEVIRAAYRVLSQRHHPDRNPGNAASAAVMQSINDAYALLSDPQRRAAYDASLRAHSRRAAPVHARHAAPSSTSTAAPQKRARRAGLCTALVAALALPLAGAGIGLWQANRTLPPVPARPVQVPAEWRIHGVDSQPHRVLKQQPAPRLTAEKPAFSPDPSRVEHRVPASVMTLPPAQADSVSPARPPVGPPLPIVADPNGRPWPLGAAYVTGLPQTHHDGRSAVMLDNAMNPAPVFVTLVALDDEHPQPVRHVHVPAMGAFRVESIRAGRYEVQHRNLVTGALTRSEPFELRQIDGRYGTQASERAVALDPWASMRSSVSVGVR